MQPCHELSVLLLLLRMDTVPSNSNALDWPLFYSLILRHRIWHQIQTALALSQIKTPATITEQLASHCKQDKLKIIRTAAEIARMARTFNQANIQYCVLKGIVLNVSIYDTLDARPCKDIDVWVHPEHYQDAVAKLLTLGYQQHYPAFNLHGFKKKYYLQHKHDIAFYHPSTHIIIELHFNLDQPGLSFFVPTPSMLKPVDIFNTRVQTLNDDYHLLYLMVHGSIHAWSRLRWLNDIVLFLQDKRCDIQNIMQLARQIHCEHVVQQSLMLVSEFFMYNDASLQPLVEHLPWRTKQFTALAREFIIGEYQLTDGASNIRMFLKRRYYVVLGAVKQKKIRALLGDLFKLDEVFPYVTFPDRLAFLYYLVYPAWVVKFLWQSKTMPDTGRNSTGP